MRTLEWYKCVFLTGGYYTVKSVSGLRILALNTNLYYTSDKVTAGIPDPADQFRWMEHVLNNSLANNEKVYMLKEKPNRLNDQKFVHPYYPTCILIYIYMYRYIKRYLLKLYFCQRVVTKKTKLIN